ncbi:hypothetical protein [Xanthobacter sp. VNH20]|uniref:hypothetical protein n=1 Tax=Xanthobacter sp. VNH20 TaxID=3156616 RepID=UPI0032B39B6A
MSKKISHLRRPASRLVPIDQIEVPSDFRYDPPFIKLLKQADAGSIAVAFTRIRTDLVTSGFFVREGQATVHVSNLKQHNVPLLEAIIRRGDRPPLGLYWSSLSPHPSKLVCPDDEAALAAYESLGIKYAPAMIYSPREVQREEGSIWSRMKKGIASYDRALAPEINQYAASRRVWNAPDIEGLAVLRRTCADTRGEIRTFHAGSNNGVHYHQMLHALLLRHERVLDTIGELLSAGRLEPACAVVRMAYEAFLGFYVDWLAPSFIGPRLQLVSRLSSLKGHTLTSKERANEEYKRRVLGGFETFLTSVQAKARISPLGEYFHDIAYPPLSWVAHQSYGVLERESLHFEEEAPEDNPGQIRTLLNWLNVITTALVLRARNDVGCSEGVAIEMENAREEAGESGRP